MVFDSDLIAKIKEGKVVIFVGAGASSGYPTKLPNFYQLTCKVAKEYGLEYNKKDSPDKFLGDLEQEEKYVKRTVCDMLKRRKHNTLHQLIIDLFLDNPIRIVTTNYDNMLEQCLGKNTTPIYNAPALPLGGNFEGIVHIHGNVKDPENIVLTDTDFGLAYINKGYASRFLIDLFMEYTVLFIGYSYNDTIINKLFDSCLT